MLLSILSAPRSLHERCECPRVDAHLFSFDLVVCADDETADAKEVLETRHGQKARPHPPKDPVCDADHNRSASRNA